MKPQPLGLRPSGRFAVAPLICLLHSLLCHAKHLCRTAEKQQDKKTIANIVTALFSDELGN